MIIYTIGFTKKSAETFFSLLNDHEVQRLVDVRLNPSGQLAGFAKQDDLAYFLKNLAGGCDYVHMPLLAPTPEILKDYRVDKNWERYVRRFEALMDKRDIPNVIDADDFRQFASCLLCSEATADQCHRRLVAERFQQHWPGVKIIHL